MRPSPRARGFRPRRRPRGRPRRRGAAPRYRTPTRAGRWRAAGRASGRQRQGGHAGEVDRQRAAALQQLVRAVQGRRQDQQRRRDQQVVAVEPRRQPAAPPGLGLPGRRDRRRAHLASRVQAVGDVRGEPAGVAVKNVPVGPVGLGHEQVQRPPRGGMPFAGIDVADVPGRGAQRLGHGVVDVGRGRDPQPAHPGRARVRRHGEAGLKQPHARDKAGHVGRHRPHGVQARRQRPDPGQRDPSPRGLQPADPAAGRRDPDRSPGVGPVGHLGLARGHGHRRPAGGAARHKRGVERVHRRAEPRVDPGDPEG